ncbi:PPC domain-containing protein [Microseira wollei]|nr:PPC domain-containing protein [Microseira wollei]
MILCLLGVTSLSPPAIAETEGDLNICTNSFVSTGRTFAPGDELDIRASGRINFGFVAGSGGPNGIDFPADYNYFPDVSHGRLMGRIKQPGMEDLEGWFFIGEARKITVPASGILEFLVNDKKPGDNSGQFCIQVINVNSSNPQASRTNPARQTRRERASTPQTRRERASTPQIVEGKLDRNSEIMLQNNAYFNVHEFTGRAGQQIAVELTSSEFDAYLFLVDSTGKTLAADDDGGGSSNARILMRLPLDGTYHVVVTSAVGSTTGSYRLVWSETVASTNNQPTQQQLSPFMQLLSEGLGIPTSVTEMAENPYFRLYYFLMGGRARSSEEIVQELGALSNQIANNTSRIDTPRLKRPGILSSSSELAPPGFPQAE